MSQSPSCATCRFFADASPFYKGIRRDSEIYGVFGYCHRHPPVVFVAQSHSQTVWPQVQDSNSCGDHQEIEAGKLKDEPA